MSNVGGAGTGIGDPPNVLIVNHDHMKEIGKKFILGQEKLQMSTIKIYVEKFGDA